MQFPIRQHTDSVAIVRAQGALTRTSTFVELKQLCGDLASKGNRAILVDLTDCPRANMSGLAALVELSCSISNIHLAFCGLKDSLMRKLANTGLDRGLHIYKNADQAMRSKAFRKVALSHTKAVILCNGDQQCMSPVSDDLPVPMLDILGRTILERLVGHLNGFGVENIITNPGHLGDKIGRHFLKVRSSFPQLRFSNEGAMIGGQWVANPIGTAGSLMKIQSQQSAFDDDFLVLHGDTLSNINLAELMAHHKESHADVTVALPRTVSERDLSAHIGERVRNQHRLHTVNQPATLSGAAAYVFSPKVLDQVEIEPHWDIVDDLLPVLLARKCPISVHRSDFSKFEIRTPQAYAQMLLQGAKGHIPILQPSFNPRDAIWQSMDAEVSPKARIAGCTVIGAGAKIGSDVELLGTCVIGQGAQLSGPSILEDCIVLSGTKIAPGFWAQNMTLHNQWAFDHRFDDVAIPQLSIAVKNARETPRDRAQIRRSA